MGTADVDEAQGNEDGGHRQQVQRLVDLVAILVMVGIAFAGRLAFQDLRRDDERRGPHQVEAVTQRFASPGVDVGDCLTGDPADRLSVVVEVDCAAPHLAKVIAEVTFPAPDRAPYPSDLGWSSFFSAACSGPTSEELGQPLSAVPEVFTDGLVPTPEQWRVDDDRSVLCTVEAAFEPDGSRSLLHVG